MNLRDFLITVSANYSRSAPMSSPTQLLLRSANDHLGHLVPGGMLIIGGGGRGNPAFVPWVGVFNPDETTSPQDGMYIVYLFSTDLHRVTLSLNQGVTATRKRLKSFKEARKVLANDASLIRNTLGDSQSEGLSPSINLDPEGVAKGRYDENLRTYEAANVWAKAYDLNEPPSEESLRKDLRMFINLYELGVATKRSLLQSAPGAIGSPSTEQKSGNSLDNPLYEFKPKDDPDYVAWLEKRKLVKTRRHETLITQYGEWVRARGFTPSTEHPKDLVLRKDSLEWLVEGKVVRHGNAMYAVREAVGQLLMYRRLNYTVPPDGLVALFSESIGSVFAAFLTDLGIVSVWKEEGGWHGIDAAIQLGLADG